MGGGHNHFPSLDIESTSGIILTNCEWGCLISLDRYDDEFLPKERQQTRIFFKFDKITWTPSDIDQEQWPSLLAYKVDR